MSSKTPDKLFEKSAFGYRPDEVDRYVEQLNTQIRTLEAEKAELAEKMKILAEKITEYRKEEGALRDAMIGAQKMGSAIVAEAKTKADMMVTDAKSRSERMIYEAQKTAEETLGTIRAQVDREKMNLAKMEKAVSDFKNRLLSLYKVHLNAITSLPDMEEEYEEFYNSRMGISSEARKAPETAAEEAEEQPVPEKAEEVPAEEAEPENPEEAAEISGEAPAASEDAADSDLSTMRFDRVPREAPAAPRPGRKLSFEEKFGDLKFGKNNPTR